MEETIITSNVPSPEATARFHVPRPIEGRAWPPTRPVGTAVMLGGKVWLLADAVPPGAEVWDRLYDQRIGRKEYDSFDVLEAAAILLLRNYDLSAKEVVTLIRSGSMAALTDAVERAFLGPPRGQVRWTWGDWVIGSLWANGIDPRTIPPEHIRQTMEILVATGRTVSEEEGISINVGMAKRRTLFEMLAQ